MTPEQMLELEHWTPCRMLSDYISFDKGTTVYRCHNPHDDEGSCYFENGEDGHFLEAHEVELIVDEMASSTLCAGRVCTDFSAHMELFQPEGSIVEQTEAKLGVFRPVLETRKVGKIRVELVDDGFPLALREVAKVMTWAQTAKGYKDHDWQNLPNPEIALAAAASRHRSDYIMQRVVDGLPATECVDPESSLIHKAHEAFGVLAQLELALRGKFVDSRHQVGV